MQKYCARFLTVTGHFFLTATLLLILSTIISCSSNVSETTKSLEHNCAQTILLVFFANSPQTSLMPEAAFNLSSTAAGRFHNITNTGHSSHIVDLFESADQAGKLLLLILPETENFSGSRDHLVINISPAGLPVTVQPELGTEFLADSLWADPLVRQSTVKRLSTLFKPDITFQYIPENSPDTEIAITEYWHQYSFEENISIALFSYNSQPMDGFEFQRNGWGVFTGPGFNKTILDGLSIQNFIATIKLLTNMNWSYKNDGYPAIQALENTEIK